MEFKGLIDITNIGEIEKHILFAKNAADKKPGCNLQLAERISKASYTAKVDQIGFWRYVQSGDYHYFVSRVLFFHMVAQYSFFSAHQCIENYLKGYLKFRNERPPDTHILKGLLDRCRQNNTDSSSFINSSYADAIILRFEPFYELARYPVQKNRTERRPVGLFLS